MIRFAAASLLAIFLLPLARGADEKKLPPIEALKPFNLLIGKWNGAGVPEGTLEDRNKGHWNETIMWEWKIKGDDAWITVAFDKGKYFQRGELRHLPKENTFQLKLNTIDGQSLTFAGAFKDKALTLEHVDDKTKDTHRLVFSLLHSNRIVYRAEVKPADKTFYTKLYRVGDEGRRAIRPDGLQRERVRRQRRRGYEHCDVSGQNLLCLLLRLPRCIQRDTGEVCGGVREEERAEFNKKK